MSQKRPYKSKINKFKIEILGELVYHIKLLVLKLITKKITNISGKTFNSTKANFKLHFCTNFVISQKVNFFPFSHPPAAFQTTCILVFRYNISIFCLCVSSELCFHYLQKFFNLDFVVFS